MTSLSTTDPSHIQMRGVRGERDYAFAGGEADLNLRLVGAQHLGRHRSADAGHHGQRDEDGGEAQ